MRRTFWAVAALLLATLAIGCGGSGGTTTVIRQAPAETVERTVEAPAHQPQPKPASSQAGEPAPDVVGLTLDVAEEELEEAGYEVRASNTDTTFGILVPSHYTVCTQDDPRGSTVRVLAQKYGC